jgi:hypothetical protein
VTPAPGARLGSCEITAELREAGLLAPLDHPSIAKELRRSLAARPE